MPDWFFSFDGYRRYFYSKDKLDWLKKEENDKNVWNHLRFITEFLKTDKSSDLFVTRHHYPFFSFGKLITFNNAPLLNDDEWSYQLTKNAGNNNLEQMTLQLEL